MPDHNEELPPELVAELDAMVDELAPLSDQELAEVVDLLVQIRLRVGRT